jgi:hypothetical protein
MADAKKTSEVSSPLSELSSLAKRLNTASDSINDIIKRFETTLQGFNLGLEVWVEKWDLHDTSEMDKGPEEDSITAEDKDTELGFCRLGDAWVLCLRDVAYHARVIGCQTYYEWKSLGDPRPLLKASRAERIDALPQFPALLKALEDATEALLNTIEEAKRFVNAC